MNEGPAYGVWLHIFPMILHALTFEMLPGREVKFPIVTGLMADKIYSQKS